MTVALPNSIDWFVAFGPLADRRDASAGVVEAAAAARSDRRARRSLGRHRCRARRLAGHGLPAGRLSAPADSRRRPLPTRLARVEGTDVGRLDRPAEADRVRRSRRIDPDVDRPLLGSARRLPGDARPAVPQRPARLVVPGAARTATTWSCCRASTPRRTLAAIEHHRADVIYLVPTMMKRIWRLPEEVRERLRPVVAARRVASRRAVPAVAEGGVDRLARRRSGSSSSTAAPRRRPSRSSPGREWLEHRGSVGRPIVGRVQRSSTPTATSCRPARWARSAAPDARDAPTYRYIGAEPRTRRRAAGSRSATWAGSTTTATSTSATACRT